MRTRGASCLVFSLLLTAVASCRPPAETPQTPIEPGLTGTPPASTPSAGTTAASEPDEPTAEPLPVGPLPVDQQPTTVDEWPTLGSPRAGLSLTVPPSWVNLTDQVNAPPMGNRLGINLLFAADSERTGRSLLAGKPWVNGAYVTGLLVAPPATADSAAVLTELLASAAPSAVRLTDVAAIESANGTPGHVVDVGSGLVGLAATAPNDLRTRVALFAPPAGEGEPPPSWIVVLLSASAGRWERHAADFERVLNSVAIYEVRPGVEVREGGVVVRGGLGGDRAEGAAMLERGVNDLWTFAIADRRYASLSLRPDEPHLDLALSVLGPNRQPLARIDNGFAGAVEAAADLLLSDSGEYIIEVSDFNHSSGGYTLSLTLSDQPAFGGGGQIAFGQALQAELPPGGAHNWVFTGAAGQRVSVVVEPAARTFDAILELQAPGGAQLLALDEGFSGDPELIAGYELPAAGEYAIVVRSFSPQGGGYTLSLDEGDRPAANFYDAGDLSYGSVRQEELQREEAHAWFLQGKAGDHVLIRATPLDETLDLDVWLLDERVERVAVADAFTAGAPETIETTLIADGRYIVLIRDFNGEPGGYEVVVGAAPAATPEYAGSLSYGDAIIDAVAPGAAVAWAFDAEAGDIIDIELQAGDAAGDLVLQLVGPDGLAALEIDEQPAGGDEAIRAFTVPAGGTWRVVLRDYFGSAANYRLRLNRANR